MERRFFSKNEVLFSEGEHTKKAFILKAGKVALTKQTKNGFSKEIAVLSEGEIVGELSLITNAPHSVTAKAIEEGSAYILSREDYQERLQTSDRVLQLILKSISTRLRNTY